MFTCSTHFLRCFFLYILLASLLACLPAFRLIESCSNLELHYFHSIHQSWASQCHPLDGGDVSNQLNQQKLFKQEFEGWVEAANDYCLISKKNVIELVIFIYLFIFSYANQPSTPIRMRKTFFLSFFLAMPRTSQWDAKLEWREGRVERERKPRNEMKCCRKIHIGAHIRKTKTGIITIGKRYPIYLKL